MTASRTPSHSSRHHHDSHRATAPDTGDGHGVGLTDAQRARLTDLIASAPLPPPETLHRLRGYLPPAGPD
jgi:hypothetical protein